jgi:hypothetical protein
LEAGRSRLTPYDVERGALRFRAAVAAQPSPPGAGAAPKMKLALVLGSIGTLFMLLTRAEVIGHSEPVPGTSSAVAAAGPLLARVQETAGAASKTQELTVLSPQTQSVTISKTSASRIAPRAKPATSRSARKPKPPPTAPTAAEPEPHQAPEALAPTVEASAQAVEQRSESMDELRATARARSLLKRDPQAALALLDRLSSVHPHGYFDEERAALRVFALLALSRRSDAREQAERFLRVYPRSAFGAEVKKAAER